MPFFRCKKDNFQIKIPSKFQPNRSYGSPDIKETIFGQKQERETEEKQRERSNLGGALAPPPPWRPWTRGETLLPSKGEAKQEEEGGGALSPSLPVEPECRRGNHRDGDLHQQLRRLQHQLSPPLSSGVTPLFPAVIST